MGNEEKTWDEILEEHENLMFSVPYSKKHLSRGLSNYRSSDDLDSGLDVDLGRLFCAQEEEMKKQESLVRKIDIPSKYLPKHLQSCSRGLSGALYNLKKQGIEVRDYSKMNWSEKWNLYISLLKDNDLV